MDSSHDNFGIPPKESLTSMTELEQRVQDCVRQLLESARLEADRIIADAQTRAFAILDERCSDARAGWNGGGSFESMWAEAEAVGVDDFFASIPSRTSEDIFRP